MNVPMPVPSVVFVLIDTVGAVSVDQTTPLAVIGPPPSDEMVPPLLAPVAVMLLTVVVAKIADVAAFTVIVPVAFTMPHPPLKGIV